MKTIDPTPKTVLNELIQHLLVIAWLLEMHADRVTGQIQDKHRLYFRPFGKPIGFAPNPEKGDLRKSAACKVPVAMYVLRFLMGRIELPFEESQNMRFAKEFFQAVLSNELRELLTSEHLITHFPAGKERLLPTEPAYPSIRLVWDVIQETRKDSVTAPFKTRMTPRKKKDFMAPNPIKVAVINSSLSQSADQYFFVARGIYEVHFCLGSWNPNLNLGLIEQSLVH